MVIPQKGILRVTKKISQKDTEKIKKAFEKAYTGRQQAGEIKVIKNGVLVERSESLWTRIRKLFTGSKYIEFID